MINKGDDFDRFDFIWTLFYFIVFVFMIRIIDMQIINASYYREMAEKNRTQVINQIAPRGRIITADGTVVASSKPSFSLIYFPRESAGKDFVDKISGFIAKYTDSDKDKIESMIMKAQGTMKPVKLAENLGVNAIMNLSELKNFYQGIELIPEANRYYPYNNYLSHIIGYVGKIDAADWKSYSTDLNYSMDSFVGKTGLEKIYEKKLKGKDGGLYMEVDHRGRMMKILDTREGLPGNDVVLTVNFPVQEAAEKTMAELPYKRGAAIAMDPWSGKILAYAIKPGFDPNIFVEYREDRKNKNFEFDEFNLGVQGTYPPASTFKIVTTMAALESGKIDPKEKVYCPGYYDAGDRIFKCWNKKGHKNMDLISGLANSCDVYYYTVAYKMGPLEIENMARKFRFGLKTGVELPGEKSGNLFGPTGRASKKSYWFIGDTLNLAIGQGETLVTPLQMASFMAAIASKGKIYKPYYVERVNGKDGKHVLENSPELLAEAGIKDSTWETLYEGLSEVIQNGTGQAAKISGLDIYGKTGTAQNPHGKDHAWFVAFAGMKGENHPGIAVAVMIEHGEHGSSSAAPVAKNMIKAFYREKLAAQAADEKENKAVIIE